MIRCIPQKERDAIKNALKSGSITMKDLYTMRSAERHAAFAKYVPEDYAKWLNSKFEQAMLSPQKKALANWVKTATSAKDPIRRDMLKKVDRIKKVLSGDEELGFLEDLAETKLGIGVTEEEAANIIKLKGKVDQYKDLIPENSPRGSQERLQYGFAVDNFKQYVGQLKLDADAITLAERLKPKNMGRNIVDVAGFTKSIVATLDNSFIGRQGIKTLLNGQYRIWGTSLKESFKNFGKELMRKSPGLFKSRDDAVMAAIRADIYSRPNALNGKYNAAKNGYGLGVLHEEVFPSSLPEKIPFLGRVFKASETAFGGTALRMRADLADAMIAAAEKNGVDMLDEVQATAFGKIVTAMTGRGSLGKAEAIARETNALFFSIKFLKSNFDTLTAHALDKTMTKEAKVVAAKNLLRIAGSVTAALVVAEMLNPGSVEWDPRNSNFGKIKIGERYLDITGGMGGLVKLGTRLITGKTYSTNTRKWTDLYTPEGFGSQTALDVVEDFIEGKFSPLAGAVRDIMRGQNFQGEKPTFYNTSIGLITPISAELFVEELKKGDDNLALTMIAEGLGLSVTDPTMGGYSDKWKELKKEYPKEYNAAIKEVSDNFNQRADKLEKSSSWKRMTQEERNKELDAIRKEETDIIMNTYGI